MQRDRPCSRAGLHAGAIVRWSSSSWRAAAREERFDHSPWRCALDESKINWYQPGRTERVHVKTKTGIFEFLFYLEDWSPYVIDHRMVRFFARDRTLRQARREVASRVFGIENSL
jgi:hypothetical protein